MSNSGNNNISTGSTSSRRRVGTSNSFRCPQSTTMTMTYGSRTSAGVVDETSTNNRTSSTFAAEVQRRRSMDLENYHQRVEIVTSNNTNKSPRGGGGGGHHPMSSSKRNSAVTTTNTSNLVHDILLQQDLSRAGFLFSLEANLILDDFPMTVEILKSIIDSNIYANNLNQQSIVEIVLTKCISALRLASFSNRDLL